MRRFEVLFFWNSNADLGIYLDRSSPKAGLCGFMVSDLHIPGFEKPWEIDPISQDILPAVSTLCLKRH